MDLKKIPPSMLIVLGLGATEACVQPCLGPPADDSPPPEMTSTTTGGSGSTGMDTRPGTEVGPCLSIGEESTAADSTGMATGSGSGSGSGSESGSGSGSDSGTTSGGSDSGTSSGLEGGSTIGPCLAPPGIVEHHEPLVTSSVPRDSEPASSRRAALGRLLDRDALPADIAARLRRDLEE